MLQLIRKVVEFLLVTSALFLNRDLVLAKKCPSFCTKNEFECKSRGGRIIGYCSNYSACCDLTVKVTGSCGTFMKNDSSTVYFQSPKYPVQHSNDLLCTFTYQLKTDVIGIVLDFETFITDGVKFGPMSYGCDVDQMFIHLGLASWAPPPLCGDLHGYKIVIDDSRLPEKAENLTLHAVMSGKGYRWRIKISQLTQNQCENQDQNQVNKIISKTEDSTTRLKYTSDAYGKVKPEAELPSLDALAEGQNENKMNFEMKMESENDLNLDSKSDALTPVPVYPMVVNGDDTPQGKVPWQASIRIDFTKLKIKNKEILNGSGINMDCDLSEGFHRCGGSIISDQEILTAAHCFAPNTKMSHTPILSVLKVVLGDVNKCRDGPRQTEGQRKGQGHGDDDRKSKNSTRNKNVQEFEIESVVMHYGFDRDVILHDIAIVRLKTKIKFNQNVAPIRIASEDDDFIGQQAFLSGWGRTDLQDKNNHGSDILQSSDNLQIANASECKKHTIKIYHASESVILAHGKYKDVFKATVCTKPLNRTRDVLAGEGDSGGPLVVFNQNSSEPLLVGVVSYGAPVLRKHNSSAGNFVDYFQSVAYYRNWIDTSLCALHLNN